MGLPTVWRFDACHLETSVPLTQGRNRLFLTYICRSAMRRTKPWPIDWANVSCSSLAAYVLPREEPKLIQQTEIPSGVYIYHLRSIHMRLRFLIVLKQFNTSTRGNRARYVTLYLRYLRPRWKGAQELCEENWSCRWRREKQIGDSLACNEVVTIVRVKPTTLLCISGQTAVETKATVGGVPPFSLVCLSHSHE